MSSGQENLLKPQTGGGDSWRQMWTGKTGFDWGGGRTALRADWEKAERGREYFKKTDPTWYQCLKMHCNTIGRRREQLMTWCIFREREKMWGFKQGGVLLTELFTGASRSSDDTDTSRDINRAWNIAVWSKSASGHLICYCQHATEQGRWTQTAFLSPKHARCLEC